MGIGVEGGQGSTKWQAPLVSKLNNAKWPQLRFHYALIITNDVKSITNIASETYGDIPQVDCLSCPTRTITSPLKHS